MLPSNAPQGRALLAARAQAQPEQSSLSAEGRSPEPVSEGLSSRLDVQMLFESGIRSGQELLRRGANADAIAAIVVPQVQSERNTQRIQGTLPCWISGLVHGLGGPEVAQGHVKAVISALMRESHLPLHIQQSCLHAIALALSGKNADAGVRIAYTARGEELLRDLTGPSGTREALATEGGYSVGELASVRSRRPAWDTRLQELMGRQLSPNDGHMQAWNHGLQGLHLDPLWRMDSGTRAPAPKQPRAEANAEDLATDDAALDGSLTDHPSTSYPGSDTGPQAASPSGGDAMPPDMHSGESAGPSQTSLADPDTVNPLASIRARASALRNQLEPIPDLMVASAAELEECLRPARAGLPEDARRALDEALMDVRLCDITSTSELQQLADHVQAWHSDLSKLDELVTELSDPKAVADDDAHFEYDMDVDAEKRLADLQRQFVTRGLFVQRLLEDTSATLKIGGIRLNAVAQQPSLSVWLGGWIEKAYAEIPRAVLIERLIDHTSATLPKRLPGAPKPLPRPKANDDGTALMRWFDGELQRQWRSEDRALDLSLADSLVASEERTSLATWKPDAPDDPRERELQALRKHLADRARLARILGEFPGKVAQLFDDRGEEHAIALGLTTPLGRIRPEPVPGGAGQIEPTFADLADMLDLISQHRDRREMEQQEPSGSSVSPLASAQAASDGDPRSPAASGSLEGSESSGE